MTTSHSLQAPSHTLLSVGAIFISKLTKPRVYATKAGSSKKKEYVQIEGVPAKIVQITPVIILNSLTSGLKRSFAVSRDELQDEFIAAIVDTDGFILNASKYPCAINISEFDSRNDYLKLKKAIDRWVNALDDKNLKAVFKDKFPQILASQGAPAITVDELLKYKSNIALHTAVGSDTVYHKRVGDPIFNRNCRWCPPIDITYEEFEQSPSYPAPLGIRPKDFCLPSEMNKVITEMVRQIVCFKNVDEKYKPALIKIFSSCGFENIFEDCSVHRCKYCGGEVDINDYSSSYKSSDNFIEICHRDPNAHFTVANMYWGHGECNRRQGGYTEQDRINDAIRLLENNLLDYPLEQRELWYKKLLTVGQSHTAID